LKKKSDVEFVPFEFTCPVCRCVFVIEAPEEFSYHTDDGEAFLLAECPECLKHDAYVRLNKQALDFYLPFVNKYRAAKKSQDMTEILPSDLHFRPFEVRCDDCLTKYIVNTINPVEIVHWRESGMLSVQVTCPKCGGVCRAIGLVDIESLQQLIHRQ